jgi:hypothetical protein
MTLPSPVIVSFILSLATVGTLFGLLWYVHRERYMGWWAIAWGLHVVRTLPTLAAGSTMTDFSSGSAVVLTLARTCCIVLGAAAYMRRPMPRWWWALVAIDGAAMLGAFGSPVPVLAQNLHFGVIALAYLLAALAIVRRGRVVRPERLVSVAGFIMFALLLVVSPTYLRNRFPPEWIFVAYEVTQLLIGVGLTLALYRER